jgi:hypothetical protein
VGRRGGLATLAAALAVAVFAPVAVAEGSFSASDPLLEQIWASSVTTARKMVTLPVGIPEKCAVPPGRKVILDGVVRDRCVWIGDLAVTGKTLLAADGPVEGDVVRYVLRLFADRQTEEGVIPPTIGSMGTRLQLVDYTAYWIEVLHDYVLWTGDVATGRRFFPQLVRALDRWYPSQMADGLFVGRIGPDYMLVNRRDTRVAYYNAQLVRALGLGAKLARWVGRPRAASRWSARAEALRPAVHAAFWDGAAGAYKDTVRGPRVYPQDGNAFAVLAGVASHDQAKKALAYLSAHNAYGYGNSIADNRVWDGYPWGIHADRRVYPFMSFFEVAARFRVREDASALDLIRRCWGYMVQNGPGTTWETIGPYGGGPVHGSWAHGWSSGAAPALTGYVLGVSPTSPGFATFVVDPRPSGLKWARGVVPTPHGDIRVAWRMDGNRLSLGVSAPRGLRWTNEEYVRAFAKVRRWAVPATLPLLEGRARLARSR